MKKFSVSLFTISLFLTFVCLIPNNKTVHAQEIPVVVNTVAGAKVMMLLDDSGSMNAVVEHPDFDVDAAAVNDANNVIPSVMFRLESGANAPTSSHTLTPMIFEMNWGLWYYGGGNVYSGRALNDASNIPLVRGATCNKSSNGTQTNCPNGPSTPRNGINVFALHGNSSVTGSSVFNTSNLAQSGGNNVVDSSGNEFLYADYRKNDYVKSRNWHSIWAKFDQNGNAVTVNTTTYSTTGGTVVFNGKEVFLSAGWYRIEYLRWIFYVANATQLANLPGASRMEVVKDVMESLVLANPTVDFGIATFNGSSYNPGVHTYGSYGRQMWTPEGDGFTGQHPKIRAPVGTNQTTLLSLIDGMTSYGGTPITNTYIEVLRYFAGERDRDPYCSGCQYTSPIESECDGHFIIALTDGLPTSESHNKVKGRWIRDYDGDGEDQRSSNYRCSSSICKNFLDDAAFYAYTTDFSSSLEGTQNIRSYAVGLGLDFDLLDDFAANGGAGTSLRADTSQEITDALQNILSKLVTTAVGAAGVAVAEVFGEEGQVFRPRFEAASWSGAVDKFVAHNGSLIRLFDVAEVLEDRDLSTSPRTIIAGYDPDYDGATNQTIAFTEANVTSLRPELFRLYDNSTLSSSLLAPAISDYANTTAATKLIQYIHGTDLEDMRKRDADGNGKVNRLGDIVYSRPKYVGARNGRYNAMQGYTDFVRSRANEQEVLLVGANDGGLHAFDANTGAELWMYIPSELLPHLEVLSRLTYNSDYHRYYVNGQISVEDVYVGGAWKTYAMFGLGGGGSSYTVLDITDRDSPVLVYEVNDAASSGESWTEPVVVLNNGAATASTPGSFDWYMVVGTGEDKTTAGTNLLVYDLSDSTPSATVIPISGSDPIGTRTTGFTASQNDQDFNVDRGYVGTEEGDMYRVITNGSPSGWTVSKLYDGTSTQPFVAAPAVVLADNPTYSDTSTSGPNSKQLAVGVFWGSGRYDQQSDVTTVGTVSQSIFGVFDPVDITTDTQDAVLTNLTKSNLKNQSVPSDYDSTRGEDGIYRIPSGKSGFYMDLDTSVNIATGNFIRPVGMVTYSPTNIRGTVIFSTFLPLQGQCAVGGYGFVQAVNFRTGGGSVVDIFTDSNDPFFNGGIPDVNGDESYNSSDLTAGMNAGSVQPVFDAHVESIDLTSVKPYTHDGNLETDDVWLDTSTGGVLPSVSSLGARGIPGPPAILFQENKIVIQSAYTEGDSGEQTGVDEDENNEDTGTTLCHINESSVGETIVVLNESDVNEHLNHGDELGECPEEEEDNNKVTICHIPPGNPANAHTISVSQNALQAHLDHGDSQGECSTDEDNDDDDTSDEESSLLDPDQLPVNLYNQPVSVLSFHEITGE